MHTCTRTHTRTHACTQARRASVYPSWAWLPPILRQDTVTQANSFILHDENFPKDPSIDWSMGNIRRQFAH